VNADRSLRTVEVGDPIVVHQPSYQNGDPGKTDKGTVTKKARTYVTIDWRYVDWPDRPNLTDFHMDTGVERHGPNTVTYYLRVAYTPEGWESRLRREAAEKRLIPFKRTFSFNDLTTDQLERMAAIVEETHA
jgi:hypothetical protein